MIIIKQDDLKPQVVVATIFPDGTSQIWKLELEQYNEDSVRVEWYFENEAEVMHINQLIMLMYSHRIYIKELFIPFMPYGRQDKNVDNQQTFARATLIKTLLIEMIGKITTVDAHSYHPRITSKDAYPYINKALDEFDADVIVFPDEGAYNRYGKEYQHYSTIVLDKVRDQTTGRITSLQLNKNLSDVVLGYEDPIKFLIVDDLCDGGATFVQTSIWIHDNYKATVGLYVTHGIFSKGYEPMIDAGISNFYTTKSLLRNTAGYDL